MNNLKKIVFVLVAAVLLFGGTLGVAGVLAKGEGVKVVEVKSGVTVQKNTRAEVDVSNLAEGFVLVKYTGGKNVRIRAQVSKPGAATYTYDINNKGRAETIPLTEGDGTYKISVFENTSGTKYATAFTCQISLALRSEFLPFLYPNQFVSYHSDSKVVEKAQELVKSGDADLDKVKKVFNFVVDTFEYDYERARTVQSGYLPKVDDVLEEESGICFDYAAVMAAMLRSQGVPCKLVIGYAEQVYHAWINVYIEGEGWIDGVIRFDGKNWTLMDPTYVSTGNRSKSVMNYVTNSKNYAQKYAY